MRLTCFPSYGLQLLFYLYAAFVIFFIIMYSVLEEKEVANYK